MSAFRSGLKREFVGHDVRTVPEAGLAGVKNCALLRRAVERFDVLVTVDANLRHQRNIAKLGLAVLVLVKATPRGLTRTR